MIMQSSYLKKKRLKKKNLEIDITSLLDILVILLVFLLRAYNPDESVLQIVENLTLPFSDSRNIREESITIQLDKDKQIWVEKEKIGVVKGNKNPKIDTLHEALIKERDRLEKVDVARDPASQLEVKKKIERVNIVLDQDLPYLFLKKVMFTANSAGFNKFKFVVMGNGGGF